MKRGQDVLKNSSDWFTDEVLNRDNFNNKKTTPFWIKYPIGVVY